MIQLHGIGHQMFQSFPWEHSMLVMCPVFMDVLCVFRSSLCVVCLSTLYRWYVCVTCVFCACVSHVLYIFWFVSFVCTCVFSLYMNCVCLYMYYVSIHALCICSVHAVYVPYICVYIHMYVCMLCVLLWEVVLFHWPSCIDGKVSDQYKIEMTWVFKLFLAIVKFKYPSRRKEFEINHLLAEVVQQRLCLIRWFD